MNSTEAIQTIKYINSSDGIVVKEEPQRNKETINILPHGTKISIEEKIENSEFVYCIECKGYILKKVLSDVEPIKNKQYKLIKEKEGIYYYHVAYTKSKEYYLLSNNQVFKFDKGKQEVGSYVIDGQFIHIKVDGNTKKYHYIGKVESQNKFWEIKE